ncbi:hypothetical protein Tco_0446238 [Tanacetum coccineum]
MAVLDSCPKHNMVAYLKKSEGNAEFHKIIDFLTRSSVHHALTVSPVVSTTFVEQFWTSTKSKIINNVRHITAKVAGKLVSISEASIRSDLLFDDANRIDSLPNQLYLMLNSLWGITRSSQKKYNTFKALIKKLRSKLNPVIKTSQINGYMQISNLFDEIPEDTLDHMETENAQDVGRTRDIVGEEKENDEIILSTEDVLSTDKEKVSTDKEKVSTDRPIYDEQIESTDDPRKGTEDHTEEGSTTQATQTPTSTIFRDDETIAKVLLNILNQAKAVLERKEKGVIGKVKKKENRIAEKKHQEAPHNKYDDIKQELRPDKTFFAKKLQEKERD